MISDGYSVGQVAELAHVSVRTLHHYEDVGLLRPSGRTPAGHRRYSPADLERLRQILVYRELDFGLDEVADMLGDPHKGTEDHLRNQHRTVRERIDRQQQLLRALEKEMEARTMGISISPEEQFEIFGDSRFDGEYAEQAEHRWGDTDAWRESQRRTAAYTKDDWITIKQEADANMQAFAALLRAGAPATSGEAMQEAEQARLHMSRWFYDCSHEFHRCLAQMYVADPRFEQTYEDIAPGLARYVHDAILANSAAHGAATS